MRPPSVIHKVLDVLLLFRDQQERYSVEEISQLLDMPKSTVYRCIRILHEKGLLEKVRWAAEERQSDGRAIWDATTASPLVWMLDHCCASDTESDPTPSHPIRRRGRIAPKSSGSAY
jgi:hypothetical protein